MMRRFMAVIAATALWSMPLAAADAPQGAAKSAGAAVVAAKIGFVSLDRVLRGYDRRKDSEGDLRKLRTSLDKNLESLSAKVKRLNGEIEQLAADTPERREKEEKFTAAYREFQTANRENQRILTTRSARALQDIYADILREAEALGREGRYDIIFKTQSADRPARTHDQAVLQISQQIVLYSKPEYDISDAVVERLNRQYAERAKSAAPGGAKQPVREPAK